MYETSWNNKISFGEIGKVFPFEEYFDYSVVGDLKRNQITEVLCLAVDPSYQGTDVLLRLFQEFAIEAMTKECIASVCMATKKLAPYYQAIGSKKISIEVNHPYLKDEALALYLFEQKRFGSGKMSAIAWFGFAKDTLSHLNEFSFVKGVRRDLLKYPMLGIELLIVWIKRFFKN